MDDGFEVRTSGGWRLLERGELIREGDEWRCPVSGRWQPPSVTVGQRVKGGTYRRWNSQRVHPLPIDAATRKAIPVYSGCLAYFPHAIAAVAQLSAIANEQHSPGEPLHWAKEKSADELDALGRHLLGQVADPMERDADGVLEATKIAWRSLANLQRLADQGHQLLRVKDD